MHGTELTRRSISLLTHHDAGRWRCSSALNAQHRCAGGAAAASGCSRQGRSRQRTCGLWEMTTNWVLEECMKVARSVAWPVSKAASASSQRNHAALSVLCTASDSASAARACWPPDSCTNGRHAVVSGLQQHSTCCGGCGVTHMRAATAQHVLWSHAHACSDSTARAVESRTCMQLVCAAYCAPCISCQGCTPCTCGDWWRQQ
jgi:hypothetical protein